MLSVESLIAPWGTHDLSLLAVRETFLLLGHMWADPSP